ncbi:UDP binding domain-containing protein [Thermodesulfobacteriota bacterium]
MSQFGFANRIYVKADTGDIRESPAIFIAKKLIEEKAQVVITDPKALGNAKADLHGLNGKLSFIEDPYKAAGGCDAIAVVTEWDLYRDLDYEKIFNSMRKPSFIFDGRNILDHQKLFQIGFNVYPIGKPKLTHFIVADSTGV